MKLRWRCLAPNLPPALRADCDAHGDTNRGAEKHTNETGHPTCTYWGERPEEK